ncbi:MAG: hypothetical protein IT436_07555 [Phycisphaerales bacterium]|nr:hypothetical protein [Phycisphaerales bacterium]
MAVRRKKSPRPGAKLLGEFQHEAADRVYVLMETLDRFVLDHEYLRRDPSLAKLGEEAHDALFKLYQSIWHRQH